MIGCVSFIFCLRRKSTPSGPRPRFPGSPEPYVRPRRIGNSVYALLVFCSGNFSLWGPSHCNCSKNSSARVTSRGSSYIALVRLRGCDDGFLSFLVVDHYSTARAQVRNWSIVIVSILEEAQRSRLTYCGSPDTKVHLSRVRRCNSAKNSSMVSFYRSRRTVNWSNVLNTSVMYSAMRALLISSESDLCSFAHTRWYTVIESPHSRSGKTCSTLFIADQLDVFDPFYDLHVRRSTAEF